VGDVRKRALLAVIPLLAAVLAVSVVSAVGATRTQSVTVGDNYFRPTSLTVRAGTKVQWKWAGVLAHNVTVQSGPVKFHSRTQVRGSFSYVFTKKGSYALVCTIHPSMTERVMVR
jgi:plastocyanin